MRDEIGAPYAPDRRWEGGQQLARERASSRFQSAHATPTRPGEEITHALVDDLVKRLGRQAKIAAEFRHATSCATLRDARYANAGADQDAKTTIIYVQVDDEHVERQMLRFAGGGLAIEEDEELEEAA